MKRSLTNDGCLLFASAALLLFACMPPPPPIDHLQPPQADTGGRSEDDDDDEEPGDEDGGTGDEDEDVDGGTEDEDVDGGVDAGSAEEEWKFDPSGWIPLWQKGVDGGSHDETFRVRRRLTELAIVVYDSDLFVESFHVTIGKKIVKLHVRRGKVRVIKKDHSKRLIGLPGKAVHIESIHIKYRNDHRRGRARVEIYGH